MNPSQEALLTKARMSVGRIPPEFHRFLIEGQDSRNAGDYDIDPKLSKEEAAIHIGRARQFLVLGEQQIHSS